MVNALIFFVGITTGSFGGILMKMGADRIGSFQINGVAEGFSYILKVLTNPFSFSGLVLYFLAGLIWSYLLLKLDISFVQPILALTYVATPILAILFLHEKVEAMRWLGILVIIIGVIIVARTTNAT